MSADNEVFSGGDVVVDGRRKVSATVDAGAVVLTVAGADGSTTVRLSEAETQAVSAALQQLVDGLEIRHLVGMLRRL